MKRLMFIIGLALVVTPLVQAYPHVEFANNRAGWRVFSDETGWKLQFPQDSSITITQTMPDCPLLIDDIVRLPTMQINGISEENGVLRATLTPDPMNNTLRIYANEDGPAGVMAGEQVFEATVGTGSFAMLEQATIWNGFYMFGDDLDVLSYEEGYSVACLDRIGALGMNGGMVDLSLSGDDPHAMLYDLLLQAEGETVSGPMSGTITAIPAPGALLLSSVGAAFIGWVRRKRLL